MGKILENFGKFWKKFFEICENFLKNRTTVYKAGLSKVGHLNNLVTKIITKYAVLTTYKILKNKKIGDVFFTIFENFISC